jgi:hypothetical protein
MPPHWGASQSGGPCRRAITAAACGSTPPRLTPHHGGIAASRERRPTRVQDHPQTRLSNSIVVDTSRAIRRDDGRGRDRRGCVPRLHTEVLCPTLREGEVVVADNLSAHKAAGVQEVIAATGAQVTLPAAVLARPEPDRAVLVQDQGVLVCYQGARGARHGGQACAGDDRCIGCTGVVRPQRLCSILT